MEASTGFKSCQQSNAANGTLQPGLPSPAAIPLHFCLYILDLKDAFFFFLTIISIQNTEKNLLSIYHCLIIRALGIDFIGQCCPKAWLTVPLCVRNLLLQQ
jgi:hypothetical protein